MRWVICALVVLVLAPSASADEFNMLSGAQSVGPANIMDWRGFYVGGQVSYSDAGADFSNTTQAPIAYALRETTLESEFAPSNWPVLGSANHGAAGFGGFVGYNTQFEKLVLGVEANYDQAALSLVAPNTPITRLTPADSQGDSYLINITGSGSVTAGPATAQVTLPYRGVLRVCPSTTVRLSVDSSAAASDVPGLLIGLDGGAIEASFAIARDSDVLLTPNFRILIGGPGSSEVKVRLGQGGDTCVDNSGANAPYVVVTSVFDSGLYRVQPGQRVMFEHGDLKTVVDDEKEPCGCPPPGEKANEFPLAKSAGLAPPSALPPTVTGTNQPSAGGSASTTMIYNAPGNGTPQLAPIPAPDAAPQTLAAGASRTAKPPPAKEKPGFFKRVGRFFRRIFGAE